LPKRGMRRGKADPSRRLSSYSIVKELPPEITKAPKSLAGMMCDFEATEFYDKTSARRWESNRSHTSHASLSKAQVQRHKRFALFLSAALLASPYCCCSWPRRWECTNPGSDSVRATQAEGAEQSSAAAGQRDDSFRSKDFFTVVGALVLVFVLLHLTGHGFERPGH
jgi:hypothetical protein